MVPAGGPSWPLHSAWSMMQGLMTMMLNFVDHVLEQAPGFATMKDFKRLLAYVVSAQLAVSAVSSYEVPPGSPGFYHGNSSAAVTFDEHSLFLDDKRVYVYSGEIHTWRIPSGPVLWRDIFQKFKAAGFNSISVYHHWGLSEGKQGSLDFDYYRSHTDLYQVAKEVGLLVISRPGPYINAETNAGGFPGWLTNEPAKARTSEQGFYDAWIGYMNASAKFMEPFQYPDGPIIAVQSENEFFESSATDPGRSEHMVQIEESLRGNGLTKIPITHNDAQPNGRFAHGLGEVDLYLWDSYPQGFNCRSPETWPEVNTARLETAHQAIIPDVMWGSGEFQGGAFDPWGGSGYDQCALLTNEQFANVHYKNNLAVKTTLQNIYMTYGGTNWGNLAEPTVYTSYDYGAPVREDRTLSPKFSEMKLQAGFAHSSPDYLVSTKSGNGTSYTNSSSIYTTALSAPSGANFYVIRQTTAKNLEPIQFTIQVNTTEGVITVPQFGGAATLDGRESQIIVSEYPYGKHKLKYSTAEVFTWNTIDGVDNIILYAESAHSIETVVSGVTATNVTVSGSDSLNARAENGTVIIIGKPSGITTVSAGNTTVFVVDKRTAYSGWNVHHTTTNLYDRSPDALSVFVFGPYLVRNATLSGDTLALHGDVNATTTVDIVAPQAVTRLTWNGAEISINKTDIGTLRCTVEFSVDKPSLPSLKEAEWVCTDSLSEIQPGFDDSAWVIANKTSTPRPYQPLAGKFVLYADEYGFHQGNTIARGHFKGKNATGVQLSVQGGFNFGYSAWLNSKFLGSAQGTNQYSADGGQDMANNTWTFDAADLNEDDNVVTVVVDPTGLEEDYNGQDTFKTPRGIRGYALIGGEFDHWKIQGNLGGEDYPDKVRGPLNEGGLFVEREGAHLPGFAASSWNKSGSCTPFAGIAEAGIYAYRTTFDLSIPAGADIPVAIKFTRTPSSSYRSVIFINGWQFGRFNSRDGPQEVFPLPEGILNHNGNNELLVTLWSLDAEGAKVADLELITTAVLSSSKDSIDGIVKSPGFAELRQ